MTHDRFLLLFIVGLEVDRLRNACVEGGLFAPSCRRADGRGEVADWLGIGKEETAASLSRDLVAGLDVDEGVGLLRRFLR
jgi:hypothetical protein